MANKNEKTVQETVTKSEAFFEKNKKAIAYGVIAILVIIAGFFCYKEFVGNPREAKASTALARGQEYFGMEQYDKALNGDGAGYAGFVKIASDYSSTDAGNLAMNILLQATLWLALLLLLPVVTYTLSLVSSTRLLRISRRLLIWLTLRLRTVRT